MKRFSMKQITALLLTLAMLLSFCPATVWADEQAYTDDQVYVVEEEADNMSEEEIASTPEEEVETPSLEETEYTENSESVYASEPVVVSAPLTNSVLSSAEARWGLANGTSEPLSWVNSGGTLADAMTYANGLATGTAYIQLRSDVNITDTLVFDYGKTTILDLNGCDIDRGLSEDENDGSVIRNEGKLTLCDTSANATTAPGKITGGNYSNGGGVFNVGDFVMNGGAITGNTARYGGGVYSFGNFTMNGGTISGNSARDGGGVASYYSFTMNSGTISGNVAESGGGLISNSEITMTGGTIIGNNATQFGGGGVYFIGSEMKISGTPIISGNVSNGTLNTTTGLYELGEESNYCGGPLTVVGALNEGASIGVTGWDTIAIGSDDPAYTLTEGDAAKFFGDNGSIVFFDNTNGEVQLNGSVSLSGPSSVQAGDDVTLTINLSGSDIVYVEATLEYDSDCLEYININSSGGLTGWDVMLSGKKLMLIGVQNPISTTTDVAELVFNVNGLTPVGSILDVSLKDIVVSSGNLSGRGISSWHGVAEAPEVLWGLATGEKQDQFPTTWVDGGTMSEAIAYANALTSGTAYILSTADGSRVNTLASGKKAIIDVNGKGISDVYSKGDLTICDTSTTDVSKQGTIGRVVVFGTFIMNGGSISGESSGSGGGGVYVEGTFIMNGGSIIGNSATHQTEGGGVYIEGNFTMNGGTISENTSEDYGGGVYIEGNFTMNGGTISENASRYEDGGGVCVRGENAVFTMNGGTISGNSARDGGGVYVANKTIYSSTNKFIMNGGTIKGNTSDRDGGGVYIDGAFTMNGGTISGNSATEDGGDAFVNDNSKYSSNGKFIINGGSITGNNISDSSIPLGGGVYVEGTTIVSGTPLIYGNVTNGTLNATTGLYGQGEASNYFGPTIAVVDALNEGAVIGVLGLGTIAEGSEYTITASDASKFTSDERYIVVHDRTNNAVQCKNAEIFGPSTVMAGSEITLMLSTADENIMGVRATMEYDSNALEFLSHSCLPTGWSAVCYGTRLILSSAEDPLTSPADVLSLTFRVKEDVSVGTALSVSLSDIVFSNDRYDFSVTSVTWSALTAIPDVRWGLASGTNNDEKPASWIGGSLADAMTYANGLSSGTAYIQLLSDVDTTAPLEFASSKTTILDLNGCDIDRGLTEATENGNVITVNGKLTLCDTSETAATVPGKITGGYSWSGAGGVIIGENSSLTLTSGSISGNAGYYADGGVNVHGGGMLIMTGGSIADNTSTNSTGGVSVIGQGTFTMTGGTITGNEGYQTGGVFLCAGTETTPGGILNMSGGSITGNVKTAINNDYGAGGVSCVPYAVINLSGDAAIIGNTEENDHPSNIWLKSSEGVNVVGILSGSFGVSKEYEAFDDLLAWRLVAQGASGYTITASDAAKFTSDNGHLVELDSTNNAILLAKRTITKGDVNLDGEVNADDLTALARHVAKIETLTDSQALLNADVDDNGSLSADDLTKLARYVAKIIPSL